MARIPYIPYDNTMAQIFAALNISLTASDYGGKQGWDPAAYEVARAAAWEALVDYETFDYNGDNVDDLEAVWALLEAERPLAYWSTEYIPG